MTSNTSPEFKSHPTSHNQQTEILIHPVSHKFIKNITSKHRGKTPTSSNMSSSIDRLQARVIEKSCKTLNDYPNSSAKEISTSISALAGVFTKGGPLTHVIIAKVLECKIIEGIIKVIDPPKKSELHKDEDFIFTDRGNGILVRALQLLSLLVKDGCVLAETISNILQQKDALFAVFKKHLQKTSRKVLLDEMTTMTHKKTISGSTNTNAVKQKDDNRANTAASAAAAVSAETSITNNSSVNWVAVENSASASYLIFQILGRLAEISAPCNCNPNNKPFSHADLVIAEGFPAIAMKNLAFYVDFLKNNVAVSPQEPAAPTQEATKQQQQLRLQQMEKAKKSIGETLEFSTRVLAQCLRTVNPPFFRQVEQQNSIPLLVEVMSIADSTSLINTILIKCLCLWCLSYITGKIEDFDPVDFYSALKSNNNNNKKKKIPKTIIQKVVANGTLKTILQLAKFDNIDTIDLGPNDVIVQPTLRILGNLEVSAPCNCNPNNKPFSHADLLIAEGFPVILMKNVAFYIDFLKKQQQQQPRHHQSLLPEKANRIIGDVLTHSIAALEECMSSKNEVILRQLEQQNLIPLLVEVMAVANSSLLVDTNKINSKCLWCIASMTGKPDENNNHDSAAGAKKKKIPKTIIQRFVANGTLRKVLQLGKFDSIDAIGLEEDDLIGPPMLQILGNMTLDVDTTLQQEIVRHDGIAFLVKLLDHENPNIRKEVCWITSNLCALTKGDDSHLFDIVTMFVLCGVMKKICLMLKSQDENFRVRTECAFVVRNICGVICNENDILKFDQHAFNGRNINNNTSCSDDDDDEDDQKQQVKQVKQQSLEMFTQIIDENRIDLALIEALRLFLKDFDSVVGSGQDDEKAKKIMLNGATEIIIALDVLIGGWYYSASSHLIPSCMFDDNDEAEVWLQKSKQMFLSIKAQGLKSILESKPCVKIAEMEQAECFGSKRKYYLNYLVSF